MFSSQKNNNRGSDGAKDCLEPRGERRPQPPPGGALRGSAAGGGGEALEAKGYAVLHDREKYDWPAYNGAYDRSGEAVRARLEQHPGIRVVIDLHRDSLGGRKTAYAAPDGEDSAQVMLLLTTGENGLYHPNWQENLKLGLELQRQMDRDYPGLARDLDLSPARYNQHLCPGSFPLEVGTEANTLREAKKAVSLFADCLAAVLETHRETG